MLDADPVAVPLTEPCPYCIERTAMSVQYGANVGPCPLHAPSALRAKLNQVLIEYGMGGEGIVEAFELHSWRCYYPDIYEPCDCIKRLLDDMVEAVKLVEVAK